MDGNGAAQFTLQKEEFLKQLRAKTAPQHEALEENTYSKEIGSGTITAAGLAFFLGKFYGFFAPLEEIIYQQDAVPVTDVLQRKKLHLIKNDLKILNKNHGTDNNDFGLSTNLPQHGTEAQKMGIMYVMEGSTLGGKVIARSLKKSLDLDPENGCSFYNCYGENTGPMWKNFVNSLTNYAVTSGKENEIIEAASETFTLFKNWLDNEQ